MSAVGAVAAASCISTGVFALSSDVLPFSAWSGDKDRPDGRQLLPAAAPVARLAGERPSVLSVDGFAPAIFGPGAGGARLLPAGIGTGTRAAAPAASRATSSRSARSRTTVS